MNLAGEKNDFNMEFRFYFLGRKKKRKRGKTCDDEERMNRTANKYYEWQLNWREGR